MSGALTSTELALTTELTLGKLETNAEQIRELVMARLEDYSPEFYDGRADEAKKDRAVLNTAEKQLNSKRLELERAYMEPFNKFKATITETCKAIKTASSQLDEIVKTEEGKERQAKEDLIIEYWVSKGFTLFEINKVFQDKWLNKTTKLKDIEKEIDEVIQKALNDLKVLDNFPPEDVPLIKSFYLDTLDLSGAIAKANDLKANRDKLAQEKAQRAAIETAAALKDQKEELARDVEDNSKDESMKGLVAAALETEAPLPELLEFALVFKGSKSQLLALRNYMTQQGITYKKLQKSATGAYTEE